MSFFYICKYILVDVQIGERSLTVLILPVRQGWSNKGSGGEA